MDGTTDATTAADAGAAATDAAKAATDAAAALAAAGGGDNWRDSLPESVRDWDEFKTADGPDKAFERLAHMRTKFGQGLYPPGEDASDSDWADFYGKLSTRTEGRVMPRPDDDEGRAALFTALGKPESAEGYTFADESDPVVNKAIAQLAFDANFSAAQVTAMESGLLEISNEQAAARGLEQEKSVLELKAEWGAAYDERTKVVDKVRETFLSFIPDAQMNAVTRKALFEIGKALGGEGATIINQDGGTDPTPTPMEAKEQAEELTKRIWELEKSNDNKPELDRLVLKRRALFKLSNAGKSSKTGPNTAGRGGLVFSDS